MLQFLKELQFDLKKCIGITTDGCSAMLSEAKGAVNEILKEATNAVYSPCHNHDLNLVINQSSKVQSIRKAVGIMQEVLYFWMEGRPRGNT